MQVVVDSLLVHYEVQGKGPVVVMLHGWGDSAKGLAGLQRELATHYRVVVVDLPGFGSSEAPQEAWDLNGYTQFVAAFLAKIDEKHIHILIGHSNGGAIAIRGLASHLLMADKLVLLASAGIRGEHKGKVRAFRYIAKTGKAVTMPLPKQIKRSLRKRMYGAIGSDMLVVEHLQESFKKVIADDIRTDAAQLVLPTLLLYGQNDTDTPVAYGELLHQAIEGSTFEIIPSVGHFLHLDQLDRVVNAIKEFD